jgi:hypothetical protein
VSSASNSSNVEGKELELISEQEPTKVVWNTKIAIVLRDDLETWQKLNVTAFTVSGIAATVENVVGEPYVDGSGHTYLPMFQQPTVVFTATAEELTRVYERALSRGIPMAIYPQDLFTTNNDRDNRAAIRNVTSDKLRLAGLALREDRKLVDKC